MSEGSTTVVLENALARFAAGDQAAKEELVARGLDKLSAIARKLLRQFGGEARVDMWTTDLVSEAYPRLAKAIDEVKPTSLPQFLGLARLQFQRVLLDLVRKRPRPAPFSGAAGAAGDTDARGMDVADSGMDDRQQTLLLDLVDAVGRLPENEGETVWLKLAGHTHKEIGEMLGVHKDTIDRYWNKACVKLAKPLGPFLSGL